LDAIVIEGIEFYGFHGATPEEQRIGHRYLVDVELCLSLEAAGESDDLADTVDYGVVASRIVQIGTVQQCRLLEALAERMAAALLAELPVERVRLRIRKPCPPMPVIAAAAGVEIQRTRAPDTAGPPGLVV